MILKKTIKTNFKIAIIWKRLNQMSIYEILLESEEKVLSSENIQGVPPKMY